MVLAPAPVENTPHVLYEGRVPKIDVPELVLAVKDIYQYYYAYVGRTLKEDNGK